MRGLQREQGTQCGDITCQCAPVCKAARVIGRANISLYSAQSTRSPRYSLHPPRPNCRPLLAKNKTMAQVIVVGGGLAGLSAAHTLLERGANVLLLDKQP